DNHVARLNLVLLYRSKSVFFAVEHLRRSGERFIALAGHFEYAAIRSKIASQDEEAAGFLERMVDRPDHLLPGGFLNPRGFFSDRAAGDRQAVALNLLGFRQTLGQKAHAARSIEIVCDKPAAGFKI